jgi:hypothetical protein
VCDCGCGQINADEGTARVRVIPGRCSVRARYGKMVSVVERLEFWPDYGAGSPLWNSAGKAVDLQSLPLTDDLRSRLAALSAAYEESKLPIEGSGDEEYLKAAQRLLSEVRQALDGQYEVVVHEDWWGKPGLPFDQPR